MQKILVSVPDDLIQQMNRFIPNRQRSKLIVELLKTELTKREQILRKCAQDIEADDALNNEMVDWEVTIDDGIKPESW